MALQRTEADGPLKAAKRPKGAADIVFCIDATGSMQPCIDSIKGNIDVFVRSLHSAGDIDFRLRLIAFRDAVDPTAASDPAWIRTSFTSDASEFRASIGNVTAAGGGKFRGGESGLDAVYEATKSEWRPRVWRTIVVVTDDEAHPELGKSTYTGPDRDVHKVVQELQTLKHCQLILFAPYPKDGDTAFSAYKELHDGMMRASRPFLVFPLTRDAAAPEDRRPMAPDELRLQPWQKILPMLGQQIVVGRRDGSRGVWPVMPRFSFAVATEQGPRPELQDAVAVRRISGRNMGLMAAVLCDGVGGRPGGRHCATELAGGALRVLDGLYRRRRLTDVAAWAPAWQTALRDLRSATGPDGAASTFAAVLVSTKPTRRGWYLTTLWAGDSRVYISDADSGLRLLTTDDHDEEGTITHFFDGRDGFVGGPPHVHSLWLDRPPRAVCLTSDGVHEACDHDELARFVAFTSRQTRGGDRAFSGHLRYFIEDNARDNFSMALILGAPNQARRR